MRCMLIYNIWYEHMYICSCIAKYKTQIVKQICQGSTLDQLIIGLRGLHKGKYKYNTMYTCSVKFEYGQLRQYLFSLLVVTSTFTYYITNKLPPILY